MTDWKVGDLAVCVDAGIIQLNGRTHYGSDGCLVEGRVYTVQRAGVCPASNQLVVYLNEVASKDLHTLGGFLAARFRKVQHDKPEACEEEFATLLKRKRVRA